MIIKITKEYEFLSFPIDIVSILRFDCKSKIETLLYYDEDVIFLLFYAMSQIFMNHSIMRIL